MTQTNNLRYLMNSTATEMERLGYTSESMRHYWEVWNRYLKFTNAETVNRADMDSFLSAKYGIDTCLKKPTRYQRSALRAMNVLEYYFKTRKIYIRFPLANPVVATNSLTPVIEGFIFWLKESDYADSTIHTHERVVRHFLDSAASHELKDISSIDTSHIISFIMEITEHRGKMSYELNSLRVFFRYLYYTGIHAKNLTLFSSCLQ